jgi:type IV pilus assembly protein PilO
MNKLKKLAWYWQLVLLVAIGGICYGALYYFVTSDIRTQTKTVEDEVAALRQKNAAAQVATQRINEFRSLFAMKTEEYDELKVLLPEQREITNVLQGLQDTAKGSRLVIRRFSPRDDSQQDFITAKPVEVEVESNFNNLRTFFDQMARLQRIVSITDFNLKQLDKQSADRTIHAQFLLTAYYASTETTTPTTTPGTTTPNATTPGAPTQPTTGTVPQPQPNAPAK